MPNSTGQTSTLDSKDLMAHLAQQKYLLVEPSVGFAMSLKAALQALKVPSNQIWMAPKLSQAKALLDEHGPNVLITEYNLDRGSAAELIDALELRFNESDRIVIITGHQPEIPVIAGSAEGLIDGHIMKPYSVEVFRSQILKAFIQKMGPSDYVKKLRDAEKKFSTDDFDGAFARLDEAKAMNAKPTRAHFLKGFFLEKLERDNEAIVEYGLARSFQPIHYKTLMAEFQLLIRKGSYKEASARASDIRSHFPVEAGLLGTFFKCALKAENFDELKALYDVYRGLDRRSAELNTIAEDSFFRAGLQRLKSGTPEAAMELFELGIVTSGRTYNYLERIVNVLLTANAPKLAETVLGKVSLEDTSDASFHRLSFMVHQQTMTTDELMNRGRQLIFSGMGSPDVFRVVVRLFAEAGKETLAESAISKAVESFPDLRVPLYEILQTHLPKDPSQLKHSA